MNRNDGYLGPPIKPGPYGGPPVYNPPGRGGDLNIMPPAPVATGCGSCGSLSWLEIALIGAAIVGVVYVLSR